MKMPAWVWLGLYRMVSRENIRLRARNEELENRLRVLRQLLSEDLTLRARSAQHRT